MTCTALVFALVAGAVPPPAVSAAAPAPAAANLPVVEVSISATGLAPVTVNAAAGQSIRFSNTAAGAVTVAATDGSFDSGPVPPGGAFVMSATDDDRIAFNVTGTVAASGLIVLALAGLPGLPTDNARQAVPWLPPSPTYATDLSPHPSYGAMTSRTQILVLPTTTATVAEVNAAVTSIGGLISAGFDLFDNFVVSIPDAGDFSTLLPAMATLRATPGIAAAAPVWEGGDNRATGETELAKVPTATTEVRAQAAWNYLDAGRARQGFRPDVLVIDSGFKTDHADVKFEAIEQSIGSSTLGQQHGTHVAGIIGAEFDNTSTRPGLRRGIDGIDPLAQLYGFQYGNDIAGLPSLGLRGFTVADFQDSFRQAFARPGYQRVRVVNASFGGLTIDAARFLSWAGPACGPDVDRNGPPAVCSPATHEQLRDDLRQVAIAYAAQVLPVAALRNAVIVVAAGNLNNLFCIDPTGHAVACASVVVTDPVTGLLGLPAGYSRSPVPALATNEFLVARDVVGAGAASPLLVVGSPPSTDMSLDFSQGGADVTAPGRVVSTLAAARPDHPSDEVVDGQAYGVFQGTSQSTPHVTGAVSFLLNTTPNDLNWSTTVNLVKATAKPVALGPTMLDVYGLLSGALGTRPLVDVSDGTLDGNARVLLDDHNVPNASAGIVAKDSLGTLWAAPDGQVDMRDFRRFRDNWLYDCTTSGRTNPCGPGPGSWRTLDTQLDGDIVRFDANLDGCTFPLGTCTDPEGKLSRFDFNGDGVLDVDTAAPVFFDPNSGAGRLASPQAQMTDLDVFSAAMYAGYTYEGWSSTTLKSPGVLRRLLVSGDIHVRLDKAMQGASSAKIWVEHVDGRLTHTVYPVDGSLGGIVTVPVNNDGSPVKVWASGVVNGKTVVTPVIEVERLFAGQDVVVSPCAARPLVEIAATFKNRTDLNASIPNCPSLPAGQRYSGGRIEFSVAPTTTGAPTLSPAAVDLNGAMSARTTLNDGTASGDYIVTARYVQPTGDASDGTVAVTTVDAVQIKYTWRATLGGYHETGSTNWAAASAAMPDCDLLRITCIDQYTATAPASGAQNYVVERHGTLNNTAAGVTVTEQVGGGGSAVSQTYTWSKPTGETGQAVAVSTFSIAAGQSGRYTDQLLPGTTTLSALPDSVVLTGLGAVSELGYQSNLVKALSPSNAPDPEVIGVPAQFFLEPDASGDSIRYSNATAAGPIRFSRVGINNYATYQSCPTLVRSMDAPAGYRIADPSVWVNGATDLGRDPVYNPGDVPLPVSTGQIAFGIEFAATVSTDGTPPPDPVLPACNVPVAPTANFVVQPQPDASLDEGDVVRFLDRSSGNDIKSWQWSFGDGRTSAVSDPVIGGYADDGSYTVSLTVTTTAGQTATTTQRITVNNVAPTIEAVPQIVVVAAGQPASVTVLVDDRGRTDSQQLRIDAYAPLLPGRTLTTTSGLSTLKLGTLPPGEHRVRLDVTDRAGARGRAYATVVVLSEAPTNATCPDGSAPPCLPPPPRLVDTCGLPVTMSEWEVGFLERLSTERFNRASPKLLTSTALTGTAAAFARTVQAGQPVDLKALATQYGYSSLGSLLAVTVDGDVSPEAALTAASQAITAALYGPDHVMVGVARVSDGLHTTAIVVLGTVADCDDPPLVVGVAPTLTFTAPSSVNEGTNFDIAISAADVDGDLADVVVDLGGPSIADGGKYRYVNDGTYTLTVSAVDEQGHRTTTSQQVVVANVAPAVLVETQGPFVVGEKMILTVGVVDPGEIDVSIAYTVASPLLNVSGKVRDGTNLGQAVYIVTPTVAGLVTFDVTFTSPDGTVATKKHTITVAPAGTVSPTPTAPPNVSVKAAKCATAIPMQEQASDYLALSNSYRVSQGLAPLEVDPSLTAAAEKHLADMVTNSFFEHQGSDLSRPFGRAMTAGYAGNAVGENLARFVSTPTTALAGWQMSPLHHSNLLHTDWRATGIAVGNTPLGVIWVQVFGDVVGCPATAPTAPTPEVLANPTTPPPGDKIGVGSSVQGTTLPVASGLVMPATLPASQAPADLQPFALPPIVEVPTATVSAYTISNTAPLTGEVVTITNRSRRLGVPTAASIDLPGGGTRSLPADGAASTRFVTAGIGEVVARVLVTGGSVVARGRIGITGTSVVPTIVLSTTSTATPLQAALGGMFETVVTVTDVNNAPLSGRTVRVFVVANPAAKTVAVTGDNGTATIPLRLDVGTAGPQQIRAVVLDEGGLDAGLSNVLDVNVTTNVVAIADAGGPYLVNLGDSVTFDASNSYDPGLGGAVTGAGWDLDGDGQFGDASPTVATVQWPIIERIVCHGACEASRDYPIAVQVLDEVGAPSMASTTLRFQRDFGIFVGPQSQSIAPGNSNQFTISIVTTSGFNEEIDLTAPGLPVGVTAYFSPARVRPGQQSVMYVALASTFQGVTSVDLNVRGVSRLTQVQRTASPTVSVVFGLVPVCTTTFSGTVVNDDTGLPVAGVMIQGTGHTVVTDANGHWRDDQIALGYNNGPQGYGIYTALDGYWQNVLYRTAVCGVNEVVDQRIKPVKTIPMRVFARVGEIDPRNPDRLVVKSGIPAGVQIFSLSNARNIVRGPGYVDFDLPLNGDNSARVVNFPYADATGYWYSYVQDPPTVSIADVGGPRIEMFAPLLAKCSARISSGIVRDPTGAPTVGASISGYGYTGTVLTDANGRYPRSGPIELAYRNTATGAYVYATPPVGMNALGRAEYTTLGSCDQELEINIQLTEKPTPPPPPVMIATKVSGTVTDIDTGAPMGGISVNVYGTLVTADAAGKYVGSISIQQGTAFNPYIWATKPGYWDVYKSPRVAAGVDTVVDLQIRKVRFGAAEVVVRDLATGLPIAGASVYTDGKTQTTGPDGRLRFDPVRLAADNQPQLQYVQATVNGYWTRYLYYETRADETSFVDLGLLQECQPAEVRGLVLDAVTNLPIAGADVNGGGFLVKSAADGTFAITGIRMQSNNTPWRFNMSASKAGYVTQSKLINVFCGGRIAVDYGPQPIDPGAVEGTVTRTDTGLPVAGVVVATDFGGSGVTDATGFYRIIGAPTELDGTAKNWGVTAQAPFENFLHPASTIVTIQAGKTTQASLALDPLATPNRFPVASVVNPATGPEGSVITLDASESSDPDGDALTYSWDLNGDNVYDDAVGATTTMTFPVAMSRTVRVKVTDSKLLTATAPLTVVATNVAPVVTVGGNVTLIAGESLTRTVTFTDPGADSWTADVAWNAASSSQSLTGRSFDITRPFPTPGSYLATVTVRDTKGGVDTATFTVTVNAPAVNAKPTALISGNAPVNEGNPLTLSGVGSVDTDGSIASYSWAVDGAAAGDQPTLLLPNTAPGTYRVVLTVTDNIGATGTTAVDVVVGNVAPTITGPVPATALVGASIVVPLEITDPGSGPLTATIDWGAGGVVEPATMLAQVVTTGGRATGEASHSYVAAGIFTVVIEGCDSHGGCTTRRSTIEITEVGVPITNHAPQLVFNGATSMLEGATLTLSAAASSDADGDLLTFAWTVDGAAAGSLATLDLAGRHPGTLAVAVTVSDGHGGVVSTTVSVTVHNVAPTISMVTSSPSLQTNVAANLDIHVADAGDLLLTLTVDDGHGPSPVAVVPVVAAAGFAGQATVPFSSATPGKYTISAMTCDPSSTCATSSVTITVTAPPAPVNRTPVAAIAGTLSIDEGATTLLSAGSSTDPDNDTLTYAWTVDGVDAGNASSIQIGPRRHGTVTVQLTVNDGHGGVDTESVVVVIGNLPPVVAATGAATAKVGELWLVDLDIKDPWSDSIETRIEWGDGSTTTTTSSTKAPVASLAEVLSLQAFAVPHTYASAGSYVVTVTGCDTDQACSQTTLRVEVLAVAALPELPPSPRQSPPGSPVVLPTTGASSLKPIRLGVVLLLLGCGLTVGSRRRRPVPVRTGRVR